jgi:alkylation response protein AidB-like acyl-CoA dehydrogenase
VRVPGRCLLGGKDRLDERLARAREGTRTGTQNAMRTFELTRPIVGAQALGIARAAYEYALDYAKDRHAFGRPIIDNQAIAFTLADMRTEVDAARLLAWRAAWMAGSGKTFEAGEGSMSNSKPARWPCGLPSGPCRSSTARATAANTLCSGGSAMPRSTPSSKARRRFSASSSHALSLE